jgi:hypothetical protein
MEIFLFYYFPLMKFSWRGAGRASFSKEALPAYQKLFSAYPKLFPASLEVPPRILQTG